MTLQKMEIVRANKTDRDKTFGIFFHISNEIMMVKMFTMQTNINNMSGVKKRWEVIKSSFWTRRSARTRNSKPFFASASIFISSTLFAFSFFSLAFHVVKKINSAFISIGHVSMMMWWLPWFDPLNFQFLGRESSSRSTKSFSISAIKATRDFCRCAKVWNWKKCSDCFWLKNSFPQWLENIFTWKLSFARSENNFSNISKSFRAPLKVKQKRELVCQLQESSKSSTRLVALERRKFPFLRFRVQNDDENCWKTCKSFIISTIFIIDNTKCQLQVSAI